MKVKEFLENFTGYNHIKIYDMHNFDTHRFNNANEAIRQFGYCLKAGKYFVIANPKNPCTSSKSSCTTSALSAPVEE